MSGAICLLRRHAVGWKKEKKEGKKKKKTIKKKKNEFEVL